MIIPLSLIVLGTGFAFAAPPDAPTLVKADAEDKKAKLEWLPPDNNGGFEITSYIVEYRPSGIHSWSQNVLQEARTTHTVLSLTNTILYEFRVKAHNQDGSSPPSNSIFSRAISWDIPGRPQNIVASTNYNSADVQWEAPHKRYPPISDYEIRYKNPGGNWITYNDGSGDATSITVTGLTAGRLYTFQVRAENYVGNGPWSETASIIPITIPNAPTSLKVMVDNDKVKLSWKAPFSNIKQPHNQVCEGYNCFNVPNIKADPTIKYYKVEYTSNGTNWLTHTVGKNQNIPTVYDCFYSSDPRSCFANRGPDTNTTINGLERGKSYDFRVSAVSDIGQSPVSNTVSAILDATPSAPTNLTARTESSTITLSWNAPSDDGGSPITYYKVEYRTNSSWSSAAYVTTSNTHVTITNLINDMTYLIKVSAVNANGIGSSSKTIYAIPTHLHL